MLYFKSMGTALVMGMTLLALAGCDQAEKSAQQVLDQAAKSAQQVIEQTNQAAQQALSDALGTDRREPEQDDTASETQDI
ncbi:UNVERIFIED_ORG: Tfp pilus assembly protein PilP [Pseudomonas parafulva]|jgi:Tfp pilus assembly protein PilP|uniref:Lipoprotein n=1 Tax=Pseudomonas fulva TaxID=47880 RepID=A0A7S9LE24_9PSED|nr:MULTISPECIES: hypothetical protein [Pseudomonas]MCY4127233.1 hypothetical protein [Pseudomonas sp.]MDP9555809.1 Tfp pilus assembly protein PilP [Pseudomonas parafulva]MDP9663423.1 Tfp pilus assembly protein PilP [Pseudomonas cremoricolorata]AVF55906.1 hypothetical protein AL527_12415 [Pseudomonas fulva]MBH3361689.1 hypothetical protein [Pseudomonas sp. URMO17WK12:I11]